MTPQEREEYGRQLGAAADQQGIGHGWAAFRVGDTAAGTIR